jgi:hypothetical protein
MMISFIMELFLLRMMNLNMDMAYQILIYFNLALKMKNLK